MIIKPNLIRRPTRREFLKYAGVAIAALMAPAILNVNSAHATLRHSWAFDEGTGTSASDSVGGNTATLQTGASWTTDRNSNPNKALAFDGSGYATFTGIGLGTVHSVAFWLNYLDSGDGIIVGGLSTETCYMPYISGPGASAVIEYCDGQVGPKNVVHGGLTSGTWYHVAITRSGTSVKFYKNGSQIGTTQTLADNFSAKNVGAFGAYTNGSFPAQCELDDMRFYDHELSSAEVAALAGGGGGSPQVRGRAALY